MIPLVWREYNHFLSGVTLKLVECEKCGTVYVYQMQRQVQGTGRSLYFLDNQGAQHRVRSEAEGALQKSLERDCDAVPCLNCGTYQQKSRLSLPPGRLGRSLAHRRQVSPFREANS
jgi:hypothetical protein